MSCNYHKRLAARRRYAYRRVTGSGLLYFIAILSVCVCRGVQQGTPNRISCYQCGDVNIFPGTPWNCTKTKNDSLRIMTIECTLLVENCSTVLIEDEQACMAGGIPPILFSPDIWASGVVFPLETPSDAPQNDCSLVMSDKEYMSTPGLLLCHCNSDLCNGRFTITVEQPPPPMPTVPPLTANDTAFENITETVTEGAVLGPSESAAIALGIIVVVLSIVLAALLGGLCYRLKRKGQLEKRRIALMKSKFEPTPLHQ